MLSEELQQTEPTTLSSPALLSPIFSPFLLHSTLHLMPLIVALSTALLSLPWILMLEPIMGSSSSSPATERERATIWSAHQAGVKVYRLNFVQQIVFIIAVLFIDKRTIKKNHSERIN